MSSPIHLVSHSVRVLLVRPIVPSPDRQNRNIHGNIFGGFLMRQAFELAHVTCGASAGTSHTGKHMRSCTCISHAFMHT
jgi:hypothetical protein